MSTDFPQVPASITWSLTRNYTENESMGGVVTRVNRTGDKWTVQVDIPPLQGADFLAFRVAYREASMMDGFFAVPDHSYTASYTGPNPVVNGASQTGGTLALRGVTPSGWMKAGDRGELSTGQVVEIRADAQASSIGEVTVSIDPPLRASPADGSFCIVSNPRVAMKVGGMSYMVQAPTTAKFSFSCDEWIGKKAIQPQGVIINNEYVSSAVTFTRASSATYTDGAGIIRTAADNVWPVTFRSE